VRVPPGQYLTEEFPVLTVGGNPGFDLTMWDLLVDGAVEQPLTPSWDGPQALPQTEVTVDIHCVTRWSKLDTTWRGVRVRDLLERVAPTAEGTHVMAHCDGGYTTNLPLEAATADEVLLAHAYAGEPLERDHGARCGCSWPSATSGSPPSSCAGSR
jgi:DMSO/TMAO reductase YedYZ molybdopterin-dependent catalytic subunit